MRVISRLALNIARGSLANVISLGALGVVLAGSHFIGQEHDSELGDFAVVVIIHLSLFAVLMWHFQRPIGWVSATRKAGAHLFKRLRPLTFSIGFDFRKSPPLPTRVPKIALLICSASLGLGFLLWALRADLPHGIRSFFMPNGYLLYVGFLSTFWAFMAFCSFLMGAAAPFFLGELIDVHRKAEQPQGRQPFWWMGMVVWLCCLMMAIVLSPSVGMTLLAVMLAAFCLAKISATRFRPVLLWQPKRESEIVKVAFGIPFWCFILLCLALVGGLWTAVLSLSLGARFEGPLSEDIPSRVVTHVLGTAFLWTSVVLVGVLSFSMIKQLWWQWCWGRACGPPTLHFELGHKPTRKAQQSLRRAVALSGFKARLAPATCRPVDLSLPASSESPWDSQWPLPSPSAPFELMDQALKQRLQLVVEGVGACLSDPAVKQLPGDGMFWVLPHFPFERGVCWSPDDNDADAEEEGKKAGEQDVGPPFVEVIPWEARVTFRQMMMSLDLDIIIVELGVAPGEFERVLSTMIELFTTAGGSWRIEDSHFAGIPGVRVAIHDVDVTNPFDFGEYREPDYQLVGRARILHVFRDKGGEEEEVPTPEASDDLLVPAGAGTLSH